MAGCPTTEVKRSERAERDERVSWAIVATDQGTQMSERNARRAAAMGGSVSPPSIPRLHLTTLRYRMKRLQHISGLDLADPPTRLACELLLTV
jgi:hypothetical protein